MESFGDLLKKARELREIDIAKIERETSISREYIEALEEERVSVFPAEPYLIGFLRNYSEYLGLDAKHLISLYKAKMIQESPNPEGLLTDEPPKLLKPLIIGGSALFVVLFLVLFFALSANKKDNSENVILEEATNGKTYEITGNPLQKRIYQGDILNIVIDKELIAIKVLETKGALTLETPAGNQVVELGEEIEMNIDAKNNSDLSIFVMDISKTDSSKGAEVRMFATEQNNIVSDKEIINESEIPSVAEIGLKQNEKQIVLFEGNRAYPFTIDVTFRGSCLFRYAPDKKDSIQDYFVSGDKVLATVNNTVRIWMSNANALKIQVIGDGKTQSLEVGRPGQVLVQDIKWIKDYDGKYKLVVLDVD